YIYDGLYYALAQIDGKNYNTKSVHRNSVKSLTFGNLGSTFYSTGVDGRIVKTNLQSQGTPTVIYNNDFPNKVVAVSPDNKWLVNASDSSYLQVFDLKSADTGYKFIVGHQSFVTDLAFMPDNSGLISVGNDRMVRFNDVRSGQSRLIKQLDISAKVIDIDPTGKWMAIGSLDGETILLSTDGKTERPVLAKKSSLIQAIKFSPDGKMLAIGDEAGTVTLWDVQKSEVVKELTGHKARVSDIEFSANGILMASSSFDGTIQMWVTQKLDELPVVLRDNDAYVWDIAFDPDNNYLLAACEDGEVRIWATNPELMAKIICGKISRNMTQEEWDIYVGGEIEFRNTCYSKLLEKP
ncbi:MAG: WD40 repeat domain-containing protein, partial [Bacteroidota bacterium]